jgi:surfactin synthase thioesterase subunit
MVFLASAFASRWIRRPRSCPGAEAQLVCFPHAGGSASYFFQLAALLEPRIEVLAVQYPGRQDRFGEACVESIEGLAGQACRALTEWLDRPYALFGHSMGALVAFEAARNLSANAGPASPSPPAPTRLIVSGYPAPDRTRPRATGSEPLSDNALLQDLRRLGGTDEQALTDPEIVALALKPMRGDYRAVRNYRFAPGAGLACPVTGLVGQDDPDSPAADVAAWSKHTTGPFDLRVFPGGHFFLSRFPAEVAAAIAGCGVR